jgi:hypothetical protein
LTPLSCLFVDLCVQSGLPSGCVDLVVTDNNEMLNYISADPRIDVVIDDDLCRAIRKFSLQKFIKSCFNNLLALSLSFILLGIIIHFRNYEKIDQDLVLLSFIFLFISSFIISIVG